MNTILRDGTSDGGSIATRIVVRVIGLAIMAASLEVVLIPRASLGLLYGISIEPASEWQLSALAWVALIAGVGGVGTIAWRDRTQYGQLWMEAFVAANITWLVFNRRIDLDPQVFYSLWFGSVLWAMVLVCQLGLFRWRGAPGNGT